jgi:hypothetical protein
MNCLENPLAPLALNPEQRFRLQKKKEALGAKAKLPDWVNLFFRETF